MYLKIDQILLNKLLNSCFFILFFVNLVAILNFPEALDKLRLGVSSKELYVLTIVYIAYIYC